MPMFVGVNPDNDRAEVRPPELDITKLEEIQEESNRLVAMIKAELIELKRNKQTQRIDGSDVYHRLIKVSRDIGSLNDCIDLINKQ